MRSSIQTVFLSITILLPLFPTCMLHIFTIIHASIRAISTDIHNVTRYFEPGNMTQTIFSMRLSKMGAEKGDLVGRHNTYILHIQFLAYIRIMIWTWKNTRKHPHSHVRHRGWTESRKGFLLPPLDGTILRFLFHFIIYNPK